MKIRLMGTYEECTQALGIALRAYTVVETIGPIANRHPSALYRVYLEVRLPRADNSPAGSPTPALPAPKRTRERRRLQ